MSKKRICAFENCGKPHRAKGYCSGHWQQSRQGVELTPITGMRIRTTFTDQKSDNLNARFWARVKKTDTCWLWNGGSRMDSYGLIRFDGRNILAHRYSWELAYGEIPPHKVIDHLCHVRSCVNPDHLRIATHTQNMENRKGAHSNSKSGIRGVYWDSVENRWRGEVQHNGKRISVGSFSSMTEAETATVALRKKLFSVTN